MAGIECGTGRGVIVLAGGQSRRMGSDKRLLPFGNRVVLEYIAAVFFGRVEHITIILPYGTELAERMRLAERTGCVVSCDNEEGAGPLEGVLAGFRSSPAVRNLVVATDMPFVTWEAAEQLFMACEKAEADGAIPVRDGRMHPLFAVFHRSALPSLERYRRSGGRKVMEWVNMLQTVTVGDEQWNELDADHRVFFNMNTMEDYKRALEISGQTEPPLL